jgi:hypothetical protein
MIASIVAINAMLTLSSRTAHGHGIPFEVGFDSGSNKITVTPTIYNNFDLDEMFFLESPGVAGNDGTPGWDRTATLPSGTELSLRFLGPLQYWNPATLETDPLPTPNATLSILAAGGELEVTSAGVTGTNPVFLASFTNHHHVVWEILDPDASGLYGLWASLESTNPGAFDADPSDPFLVVLNWGVTNSGDYSDGVARLSVSPVPEPGTWALVSTAAVVGVAFWRRRSRRCD